MRLPSPRNWAAENLTKELTAEATPPAANSLLVQAVRWPEDVATMPYCGCGHLFDGSSSEDIKTRYLAVMVAPGAVHGRAAIGRSLANGNLHPSPYKHQTWSNSGGTTGANVIDVPYIQPGGGGLSNWGWGGAGDIRVTGDAINDTPTWSTDRQYEFTTDDAPYVEPLFVTLAGSFAICVSEQVADLETL